MGTDSFEVRIDILLSTTQGNRIVLLLNHPYPTISLGCGPFMYQAYNAIVAKYLQEAT